MNEKFASTRAEAEKLNRYLKAHGDEVIALISKHNKRYYISFGESPKIDERVVFSVEGLVFTDHNGTTLRKAAPIDAVAFANVYTGREVTTVVSWFMGIIETLR